MRQLSVIGCLFSVAVMVTGSASAQVQTLESRIAAARGSVAFGYATRPNVCGDGTSIEVSDDSSPGWNVRVGRSGVNIGRRRDDRYGRCETGPARVILGRDGNRVTDVRVTVGGRPERASTELGDVSPDDAARYLLDIAPRLSGRAAEHAVMGAQIAEGVVVWRRMLQIARDGDASESARKATVFWVSQEASAAATAGIESIAADDDASQSVRSDALFYLAHRPNAEGIPALLRVAESSTSVKLRKDAIWYLAQSRDSRALNLFEKLLSGR